MNPRPPAATIIRQVGAQPSRGDSTATFGVAQERETSPAMKTPDDSPPSSAAQDVACGASEPVSRGGRDATRVGTLQAAGHPGTRDARKAAARAGALPAHAGGRRCRRDPRSRADAADRPSRAAQVCPGGVTAAGLGRDDCLGTSHTGGRRRAVWQRDQGRCAFLGRTGRCRETALLEFHHVRPHAAGGAATADNIQLRCRAHNQYEARLFFGDWFVRERQEVWEHTASA